MLFHRKVILIFLFCLILLFGTALSACSVRTQVPTPSPVLPFPSNTSSPSPTQLPVAHEIARLGKGTADGIVWSADGKLLIVGGSLGFYFYNAETGQMVKQIKPAPEFENTQREKFFLNTDQKHLTYFRFKQVIQQDLSTGQVALFDQDIQFLRVDQYDQTLAFAGWAEKEKELRYPLRVMDLERQTVLLRLMEDNPVPIQVVKISPDGSTLAVATADHLIHLFNLDNGEPLAMLPGHDAEITSLDFSPDGTRLVSAGADAKLHIWNLGTGLLIQKVRGFSEEIRSALFTPDGKWVVVLLADGSIQRMRFSNGRMDETRPGQEILKPGQQVKQVVMQPGKNVLAVLDNASRIELIDIVTGQTIHSLLEFHQMVQKVLWSPDGRWILMGSWSTSNWNSILLWNAKTQQLIYRFETSFDPAAFSPNGDWLALGYDYDTKPVQLWDLRTGQPVMSFPVEFCESIAFSHDGQILATVDRNSVIQLWQVSNGQLLRTIQAEASSAYTLQFSPDDRSLAFVTTNGLLLLDVERGSQIQSFETQSPLFKTGDFYWGADTTSSFAIIGSGNWSLNHQDAIEFRDLTTWKLKNRFQLPIQSQNMELKELSNLCIAPGGRLLAITDRHKLFLVDAASGAVQWILGGMDIHDLPPAFRPDGSVLAVGDGYYGVRLWDISALQQAVQNVPVITATPEPTATAEVVTPTPTFPALSITPRPLPSPSVGAIQPENVALLQEIARLGKGRALMAVWSGDGKMMAVLSATGVYLYQMEPFREVKYIETGWSNTLALSQNGDRLLTGALKMWDTKTGTVISELAKLPGMDVYARSAPPPRFSTDGNSVTVTLYTGKACTWDVKQGTLIGCAANTPPGQEKAASLASPDGRLAAYTGYSEAAFSNRYQIMDMDSGKIVHTLEQSRGLNSELIFSADSQTLAYGSYQHPNGDLPLKGTIEVWHVDETLAFTRQNTFEINQWPRFRDKDQNILAFNQDASRLAALTGTHDILVWDLPSGNLLYTIPGGGDRIFLSPDGHYLLSIGQERQVQIWQLSEQQPRLIQSLVGFSTTINALTFNANSDRLFASGSDGLQTWDLSYPSKLPFESLEGKSAKFAISPDGHFIANGIEENAGKILDVQLWDVQAGRMIRSFQAINWDQYTYLSDLTFSPDSRTLVTSGSDHFLRFWDVQSGEKLREIPDVYAYSLAFSPDGHYLAIEGEIVQNKNLISGLILMNIVSGQFVVTSRGLPGDISFHPNGIQIFGSEPTSGLSMVNLVSGKQIFFSNASLVATAFAISPDGSLLAMITVEHELILADPETGSVLYQFPKDYYGAEALAFSPDGKRLAIGCSDGTIRMWEVK